MAYKNNYIKNTKEQYDRRNVNFFQINKIPYKEQEQG